VQVQFGSKVDSIKFPQKQGEQIVISASSEAQDGHPAKIETFTCRLLIAADGANSTVRTSLERAQPDAGWGMEVYPSDAGGLAYKVWRQCVHAFTRAFSSLQFSLFYPVLVNPVLALIRPKTDGEKPAN
jgi:2-polyprenyl-6-methoxyphenol hydroxylase-like FAD-dependent oxidoreductase